MAYPLVLEESAASGPCAKTHKLSPHLTLHKPSAYKTELEICVKQKPKNVDGGVRGCKRITWGQDAQRVSRQKSDVLVAKDTAPPKTSRCFGTSPKSCLSGWLLLFLVTPARRHGTTTACAPRWEAVHVSTAAVVLHI